jgi:hypothetical protein
VLCSIIFFSIPLCYGVFCYIRFHPTLL